MYRGINALKVLWDDILNDHLYALENTCTYMYIDTIEGFFSPSHGLGDEVGDVTSVRILFAFTSKSEFKKSWNLSFWAVTKTKILCSIENFYVEFGIRVALMYDVRG